MKIVEKHIPTALLCLLVVKCIMVGSEYSDMGIAVALIGYMALNSYTEKHKKIQDLDAIIKKQTELSLHLVEEIDKVKSAVAGVKLSAGVQKRF